MVKIGHPSERKVEVCVKKVLISSVSLQAKGNGGLSTEAAKSGYYHLNVFHLPSLHCSLILEFRVKVTLLGLSTFLGFH